MVVFQLLDAIKIFVVIFFNVFSIFLQFNCMNISQHIVKRLLNTFLFLLRLTISENKLKRFKGTEKKNRFCASSVKNARFFFLSKGTYIFLRSFYYNLFTLNLGQLVFTMQ